MRAMDAFNITRVTLFLALFDGEQKFTVTENASISGIDIRRGIERIEDVGGTNQQLGSESKHRSKERCSTRGETHCIDSVEVRIMMKRVAGGGHWMAVVEFLQLVLLTMPI